MRSIADRIRHAIGFELIGLILVTPLGAFAFGMPIAEIGVVSIVSATIATLWNYLYNLLFDHAMLRFCGHLRKSHPVRVLHAVLFEVGLLIVLMPFIAWYLDVSLATAFLMDLAFALFYVVYAYAFNWAYDVVFPLPGAAPGSRERRGPAGG